MRSLAVMACVIGALALAPAASADFGFLPGSEGFSAVATEKDGSLATRASAHPFALTTGIHLKEQGGFSEGDLKDLRMDLPAGLIENPRALNRCSGVQFHTPRASPFQQGLSGESCPDKSQVGVIEVQSSFGATRTFGVFNLLPPPGAPSQIGASPFGMPFTLTPHIRDTEGEYGLTLQARNVSQQLNLRGLKVTLWGNPWLVEHDRERGNCLNEVDPDAYFGADAELEPEPQQPPPLGPIPYQPGTCSIGDPRGERPVAYLTLPANCTTPLVFTATITSWQQPAEEVSSSSSAPALSGCQSLSLITEAQARPTSDRAASSAGLDFSLNVNQNGLLENTTPTGRLLTGVRAPSQVKEAVVAFPEGMTINPSVGSGLGVCAPASYAAETVSSPPGAGCPNDSKIGELTVHSPLFEGPITGALFLAAPDDPATPAPGAENPFDTLLALYLVAKAPELGVLVKIAGRVGVDPGSGQLTADFDNLPQLPYSDFTVRFRDGQRSPLAAPPSCGTYTTGIDLHPWLAPGSFRHQVSLFELNHGIGGGLCPMGQVPFAPGAVAGTLNRAAGAYSPYYLHFTRSDQDQEITSYSAKLAPGMLGKIAGIPYCPEAAIAAAKQNRGFAEIANPSCPAASSIGHTVSGYGLGSVLAYAPGGLYLAGPYHGAPFSIVAIDAATVGPFDLGTIVVRSAIDVDRKSAQVSVDSRGSDPIPHIIDGIPIHLRDVRVYIDRPNLTLNPTSCDPFSASSFLNGSGQRFSDPSDDSLAQVQTNFQVSNCSALGFKPRFSLRLRGGTKQGNYPAISATVTPRSGDANIGAATVTLPPSLFLAQEHIRTVCTRVQYSAEQCPAGSLYGYARAYTPLLEKPLEGPVYLRSNGQERTLPDLVAALHGQVDVDVVGFIDSAKGGRLRASFDLLPDAPVTRFEMRLKGAKRGLLVNAVDLCAESAFSDSRFIGQNNVIANLKAKIKVRCKVQGKRDRRR